MDMKQPLSLFLVAILAASVFTVVGITSIPLQKASAQVVTIETSADELGGTFFGRGVLQVVIEDSNSDDDDDDTISVDIDADGTAASDSDDFEVPNTSAGSQRFEFFLVHVNSSCADGSCLDPINNKVPIVTPADEPFTGAEGPLVITFGDGGDLDTDDPLYEDASFTITFGNEDVTVDYEEADVQLELDRDLYGSTSLVYLRIIDQDANTNPTDRDIFDVDLADMNGELFEVDGGDFETDPITFEETGDNTAVFEAEVFLGTDFTVDAGTDTVELTLNDQAEYDETFEPINDPDVNDSTVTDEFSFEIDDSDGDIDDVAALTFGGELKVLIRDNDQNIDSDDSDTIENALTVEVDAVGGDSEEVDLEETGDNTGVFEIDLSNGELRITFLADGEEPDIGDGELQLRASDIEEDVIISYNDTLNDNSVPEIVAEFTVAIDVTPGAISAPEVVGVTDEFTVTINEPDLNDNSRTRDSYTILLDGTSPFNLTRGGNDLAEIYTFEIDVDGDPLTYDDPIQITMSETGVNTGIFEFELDVEDDITTGADVSLSDGDDIEIEINDFMADVDDPDEDSVDITIGKPSVGLDFDRTSPPIPPRPDSITADEVGTEVIVRMLITDPTLATQSNVEEIVDFVFGEEAGEFVLELEGDDVNDCTIDGADVDSDGLEDCEIVDGVGLDEVLSIDNLDETGKNTGVFEVELTFNGDNGMDNNDWQDAEFTFTYTNDEEDEESAGFTFRGNDGVLSVDQASAKTGTIITITAEDQDLNLDTDEAETFQAQGALLFLETEDEDLSDEDDCPAISDETFDETGDDTGVFTAQFEVGDDIPVSCLLDDEVEVATNILITYDDEIDSTGGSGDELEFNVPVVSSTGSIQVSPDLVGPATKITVLIVDSDLDEDSSSTDEYEPTAAQENTDDFFVSFSSSRSEVDEASPDIEETGPNTGVFEFEIELETDEQACQDDDMSDFEAEGGSDPSIGACPGDILGIRYEDSKTGGGGSSTVSEVIEVRSWDPEFVADKDSYGVGDRVTVTVSDPDANRDPDIADTLSDIRVISDSDRVGEEFSAIETGRDTGVFRLTFGTSEGTQGGAISVKQGDDITVRYTDEFPADFVDEEEDKDFDFVIPIGVGEGEVTVTPPALQDVTGRPIDEVSAGQQVVLTTEVVNQNASPQPFVALIEVRDDNGVTVFLAWQTGTLPANGRTQVGLSWTPDDSGDHEVRTFVISDLNNPRILSPVATSDITVN